MAQHDYIISNQTFPNTRADINNVLSAISTNNSGTSAPTTQYAGQFWIDTTSSTWTMYIHDGSDDIAFATIDTSANTVNFTDSALDVVTDTTPQLGGNLDLNSNDITGTGNINITGTIESSGNITGTLATASQPNITSVGTLSSLNVDASAGTGVIGITLDAGTVSTSKDSSSFRTQLSMSNTTGVVGRLDTASDDLFLRFADDLAFQSTAGSEYMRITSSGVGIGTSSPSSPNTATTFLHIGSSSDNYSSLVLEDNNNTWEIFSNNQLSFRDGTSTRMILDENGNVGIGETAPLGKLHVKNGDTGATSVSGNANELVIENTGNVGMTIQSENTGTGNLYFGDVANGSVGRVSYDHSSNFMSFNTNAAERMRINSSGNVGIGTSSPTQKLDVSGTVKATAFQGDGSALTGVGGGGKVLQVVSATDSTIRTTTSSSSAGYHTASNTLTVNITPSSTSSQILVFCFLAYRVRDREFAFAIFRDGSSGTNLGNGNNGNFYIEDTGNTGNATTITVIDSPSTTSQKSYGLFVRNQTALSDGTCQLNTARDGTKATKSYIVAMEIGA